MSMVPCSTRFADEASGVCPAANDHESIDVALPTMRPLMQIAGTRRLKFISTSSPYLTTLWHDFIFPAQPMSESAADNLRLNGTVLIACNCDWGCPCNFNAPPTTGTCAGGW